MLPRTEPASRWESPERGDFEDSDSDDSDDDSSEYSDDEGDDEKDAAAEAERGFVKRARSASINGDDEAEKVSLPKRIRRASISDDGDGDDDQ